MPRILASSLAEHNDQAWAALTFALERLLAERSFDEITMASVASAAGMARNTLYNYAPDKASLVSAVTKRASAELLSEVTALAGGEGEPLERLEAITRAILRWFVADEHRHADRHAALTCCAAAGAEQVAEHLILRRVRHDHHMVLGPGEGLHALQVLGAKSGCPIRAVYPID